MFSSVIFLFDVIIFIKRERERDRERERENNIWYDIYCSFKLLIKPIIFNLLIDS